MPILFHKVVSALPGTLVADSVYYVRVGNGFDIYVTNSGGTIIAYSQNDLVETVTPTPSGSPLAATDQVINATSALLNGSVLPVPSGKMRIGSIFRWRMSVSKTAAGTASNSFIVRCGTLGTIVDPALITFALPVGTAVVDKGNVEIVIVIRGPLTAACIANGDLRLLHNLAATGFATIPTVVMNQNSGVFDPTAANLKMSVSCTAAASTVLTFQQVIADMRNV